MSTTPDQGTTTTEQVRQPRPRSRRPIAGLTEEVILGGELRAVANALLIDDHGRVYLERAEAVEMTEGPRDGESVQGIYVDSDEWKPLEEVLTGDIRPVTLAEALRWAADYLPTQFEWDGSTARLCGLAADALKG
jgi:hypothetical protein